MMRRLKWILKLVVGAAAVVVLGILCINIITDRMAATTDTSATPRPAQQAPGAKTSPLYETLYDSNGNLSASCEYDSTGRLLRKTNYNTVGDVLFVTTYDAFSRKESITRYTDDGGTKVTNYNPETGEVLSIKKTSADGRTTVVTEYKYTADGKYFGTHVRSDFPDKSYTIMDKNADGSYTATEYYFGGTLKGKLLRNSDGSGTVTRYNENGTVKESVSYEAGEME